MHAHCNCELVVAGTADAYDFHKYITPNCNYFIQFDCTCFQEEMITVACSVLNDKSYGVKCAVNLHY